MLMLCGTVIGHWTFDDEVFCLLILASHEQTQSTSSCRCCCVRSCDLKIFVDICLLYKLEHKCNNYLIIFNMLIQSHIPIKKYLGIRWVIEQAYFPLIIQWIAFVMQSYEQMLMINTNWMTQENDIFLVE